jgi:cytochrome b
LHWALVGSVALAAISTVALFGAHRPAGYAALAIVLTRLARGCRNRSSEAQTDYASWSQFVRGPRATLGYVRRLMRRQEPRYIGHNPLGAWMVIALMACVIGLAITGWLYTTDEFWGSETVEDAHRALAWTLLVLVVLHVSGVIFTSMRHRENLVASMFNGTKRAPRDADIR